MTAPALLDRIGVDPNVCHGQAHIKGTRIMAWLVVQLLGNGDGIDEVLRAYPTLAREDVLACLQYAALLAQERVIATEDAA